MKMDESCCVVKDDKQSKKEYWDANFSNNSVPNWIETNEPWIMPWIRQISLPSDGLIFCAGVGDSNIVEALLDLGYTNIIANDISSIALNKLSSRINNTKVTYLEDDLINPQSLQMYEGKVDLYIDRATLHFFTTCPEKDHYFSQMKSLLKPQGYTMIGVFSKENEPKCCGLDLQLWSIQSLQNRLKDYDHISDAEFSFTELNGNKRNYIYQLAQKKN